MKAMIVHNTLPVERTDEWIGRCMEIQQSTVNIRRITSKHLAEVGADRIGAAVHGFTVLSFVGLVVDGDKAERRATDNLQDPPARGIGIKLFETVVAEAQ
jgi:hypothetical protein